MSLEAQFYEARRRQNFIERRQSFNTLKDVVKQEQKGKFATLQIPVRVMHPENNQGRCTCIPMQRSKLHASEQSIFQRNRDIYPRPLPVPPKLKQRIQHAKLHHRFSSTEYLQQW